MTKERLAELLWAYEMDEPHHGDWDEGLRPIYPQITWAQIQKHLEEPHQGDCINRWETTATCVRCVAEAIVHKSEWIMGQL